MTNWKKPANDPGNQRPAPAAQPVTEEDITAYAAGWLPEKEAKRVREAVASNPELLASLDRTLQIMSLFEADPEVPPPERLLHRTIATVYMRDAADRCAFPYSPSFATRSRLTHTRFRLLDLAVALVLAFVVSALLFPAITRVREYYRQAACRENLRQVGLALAVYADQFNGALPQTTWSGGLGAPAAIQPVALIEHGYLGDRLALYCPGDRDSGPPLAVTTDQLRTARASADGEKLRKLLRAAAGSYAFSTGYLVDGTYYGPTLKAASAQVLVADRPPMDLTGAWLPTANSHNHGGQGQNALYADLHVGFLVTPEALASRDSIYANRANRLGASLAWDDISLAPGDVLPEGPLALSANAAEEQELF